MQELEEAAGGSPAYEQIREERKAQQQREEQARVTAQKIDGILDKYERELKDYYTNHPEGGAVDVQAAVFRLKSHHPGSLRATLKHSVHLANRTEFRKALCELLTRPEIDSSCAEIIASFPFENMTRKLLALDVSGNAENLPSGLIISLAGNDPDVIESFLLHIKPEDYGKAMSPTITRRLLDSNDARILVPVLSLMKSNFPAQASQHRKRLGELETHPTAAVRAWAKKLV